MVYVLSTRHSPLEFGAETVIMRKRTAMYCFTLFAIQNKVFRFINATKYIKLLHSPMFYVALCDFMQSIQVGNLQVEQIFAVFKSPSTNGL